MTTLKDFFSGVTIEYLDSPFRDVVVATGNAWMIARKGDGRRLPRKIKKRIKFYRAKKKHIGE